MDDIYGPIMGLPKEIVVFHCVPMAFEKRSVIIPAQTVIELSNK